MGIEKTSYKELEQQVKILEQQVQAFKENEVSLKESEKTNKAMLRISMALPEYPDLEELLDYISGEIKRQLNTQGALVILLDEENQEFFFPGVAHEDRATQKRVKEIRLPFNSLASAEVVKTGNPLIVNDAYKDSARYAQRDREFGYSFNNYVLVPIKSLDRIIGVLAAYNKLEGRFENPDTVLLEMIAGTVGLSIENARFSDELKQSHRELQSLARAKDKAINHLSHELKTPVSIFSGTLQILEKKLEKLPEKSWKKSMIRARRNLERIRGLQDEIRDIILEKESGTKALMSFFIDQCADLLEDAIEAEPVSQGLLDRVRNRVDEIFKIKDTVSEEIVLDGFISSCFEEMRPEFVHRNLKIEFALEPEASVFIPPEALEKTVSGLIKNAIENTPDQGKIKATVSQQETQVSLVVKDYGVGIARDHQNRIFEGFFSTQETMAYSSKRSFDFNAGGRGADLLRMKIFSEKYNFDIYADSERCRFIPGPKDTCPGSISECTYCKKDSDCYQSGGATFTVNFKNRNKKE